MAMPLTDDIECDCDDYYDQDWFYVENTSRNYMEWRDMQLAFMANSELTYKFYSSHLGHTRV